VGLYFERYAEESVTLRVARVDGRLALAVFSAGAAAASYFMLLEFESGRVASIRDFRYVPYIANEAVIELVDGE
jgi:hypothetical protein